MNATTGEFTDLFGEKDYTNTSLIVFGLIMQIGYWLLKLKKRLQNNERRVDRMESTLRRVQTQ